MLLIGKINGKCFNFLTYYFTTFFKKVNMQMRGIADFKTKCYN